MMQLLQQNHDSTLALFAIAMRVKLEHDHKDVFAASMG